MVGLIRTLVLILSLLLVGCASHPFREAAQDQVEGAGEIGQVTFNARLVVSGHDHSDSGTIDWHGDFVKQQVTLFSPIGSVVAILTHEPMQTHLQLSTDEDLVANNVEELTYKVLGYPLPLDGMPWWVLAQTWPESKAQVTRNQEGRVESIQQDDWLIHYGNWVEVNGLWLPKRIELVQGDIKIRLRIESWYVVRQNHAS